jgi:hypothetical protein
MFIDSIVQNCIRTWVKREKNEIFWYDYKWNFLNKKFLLNAKKQLYNSKHKTSFNWAYDYLCYNKKLQCIFGGNLMG